jgi:hypothetical protein
MPACWAIYQQRGWVETHLAELGCGAVLDNEETYMQWLGQKQVVHGTTATNAMKVADHVFQFIISDGCLS